MKKYLSAGLLVVCSFSIYASECISHIEEKNFKKALDKCTQEATKGDNKALDRLH